MYDLSVSKSKSCSSKTHNPPNPNTTRSSATDVKEYASGVRSLGSYVDGEVLNLISFDITYLILVQQ